MSLVHHDGSALPCLKGSTLFDYADALKVRVPTSCGRTGECHECVVEIRQGMESLTPIQPSEVFLRENYRLACQATISETDLDVEFSVLRRQPQILVHSTNRRRSLAPAVTRYRDTVRQNGEQIDKYRGRILGLAVDIGTTTVAMNLVDLENGDGLYTSSFENPQRFGGSDLMHRITYDGGPYHGELRKVLLAAINFEIGDMARNLGLHRRQIYDVVVVGNTTMRDIFFGLDVQSIGQKPYKSITELEYEKELRNTTSIDLLASQMGLRVFPLARVYSGPIISCHIGSDVAAGLLSVGMDEKEEVTMLIDVGTNTEVVVGNRHSMMAASCPAGPAFEGGQVTYAMPGYEGAIESVTLIDGRSVFTTIGNRPPQGICGSGLVDLLAELRGNDLMSELGVLDKGSDSFCFAPDTDMTLNRSDISVLAQAKSANYAGQFIVMRNYGVSPEQVSSLYLAGGFANYINVSNAVDIGFIANIPEDRIFKVGNASLEGATMLLISSPMRDKISKIVSRIEHIELETVPDFFEIFVEGCLFNPMPRNI